MLLMKVVLLIWYSNKNFGFRKIESYLASKIDFEIWKCPIFASSASNCLTRYEQILSGCSLGCKSALNFTCLPMKFHNRVHTNVHITPNMSTLCLSQYFFVLIHGIFIFCSNIRRSKWCRERIFQIIYSIMLNHSAVTLIRYFILALYDIICEWS